MCIDSCFINLFMYLQYLDRLVQFSFKAGLNPLVLYFCMSSFISHANQNREDAGDRAYGLWSLSLNSRVSNH